MLALIALIVGILLVANPLAGVLLSHPAGGNLFLCRRHFFVCFLAFQLKPQPRWGWVLINGILAIVLGILIWSQWPFNASWLLGLLVGIGLLMNGFATVIYGATASNSGAGLLGPIRPGRLGLPGYVTSPMTNRAFDARSGGGGSAISVCG